jgi:hypothetical protein
MTVSSMTAVGPARTPTPDSAPTREPEHTAPPAKPKWQKYSTPALVLLLAGALVATITWKWNAWEGGKINQGGEQKL